MAEEKPVSVQSAPDQEPLDGGIRLPLMFFDRTNLVAPDSQAADRDSWLRSFWMQFGNDLLAAVLATSVAKIQAQNWVLSGPKRLAKLYHRIVRDQADFGRGWGTLVARGVQDYYTQDNGWFIERLRSGPKDHEGPCLGLAHLDSARMFPTGNAEYPYYYEDIDGRHHIMHRSQFMRLVDLPSPITAFHHHEKGFCALSRALSTAMVLTLLVAMKREKLSDLPPSAMAVFNNISKKQFEAALSLQGAQDDAKGNAVWRSLLPLFGIDPAHPADIKFISLREVWEGFDELTAYNVAAYSFAAAWRMDPREFWPVSAGPLGTGKEVEVQAEKAKAKSTGLLFTELERALNHEDTLPEGLTFKFALEDAGDELQEAQTHAIQIQNIKAMQDAGAQLNASEVRYLLAMQYNILPREMIDVPEQPAEAIPGAPDTSGLEAQGITPDKLAEMSMEEIDALAPREQKPGNDNQGQPAEAGQENQQQTPGQPGKPGLPSIPGVPNSGVPGTSGVAPAPVPQKSPKLKLNTVRIDDVERSIKEYYGYDFGPYVNIDATGEVSSPFRWVTVNDNHPVMSHSVKEAADSDDLLEKLKALPKKDQEAIHRHSTALTEIMSPDRRLQRLQAIPDSDWEEAQAGEEQDDEI